MMELWSRDKKVYCIHLKIIHNSGMYGRRDNSEEGESWNRQEGF